MADALQRPHPDLRWHTGDGVVSARLAGFEQPIARAERLRDGTWVVAVRPLQHGRERAAILGDEREALARMKAWCRALAWRYRPNAGTRYPVMPGQRPAGYPCCPAATP